MFITLRPFLYCHRKEFVSPFQKPQEKIILRDRCQPESTITLDEYLYYRVDKARIVIGKNMLEEYKSDLSKIGRYWARPQILMRAF